MVKRNKTMLKINNSAIQDKSYNYKDIKNTIVKDALKTLVPYTIKALTNKDVQKVNKVEVLFYNESFYVGIKGHLAVLDWMNTSLQLSAMVKNPHIKESDSAEVKKEKAESLLLKYFNAFNEYETIIYVTQIDKQSYKHMVDNWLICNYLRLLKSDEQTSIITDYLANYAFTNFILYYSQQLDKLIPINNINEASHTFDYLLIPVTKHAKNGFTSGEAPLATVFLQKLINYSLKCYTISLSYTNSYLLNLALASDVNAIHFNLPFIYLERLIMTLKEHDNIASSLFDYRKQYHVCFTVYNQADVDSLIYILEKFASCRKDKSILVDLAKSNFKLNLNGYENVIAEKLAKNKSFAHKTINFNTINKNRLAWFKDIVSQ